MVMPVKLTRDGIDDLSLYVPDGIDVIIAVYALEESVDKTLFLLNVNSPHTTLSPSLVLYVSIVVVSGNEKLTLFGAP